jgi:putative tryptophan/tyrosine transport system substrate-binding protein
VTETIRVVNGLRLVVSAASSLWSVGRFCFALCAMLFALSVHVEAQQAKKVPRIGVLWPTAPPDPFFDAFKQGLRELGYVQGQNIAFDERWAEGKLERLPVLAAELVRVGVDVIVTRQTPPTLAAKHATRTIPIVMALVTDPVGNGFVASLAQPGGNITGLSSLAPEISGKRLELMKEIISKLSHVAVLGNSTIAGNEQSLRETELAAGTLKARVQYLEVRDPKDIETAFREAGKAHANAVIVLANPATTAHRTQVVEDALKSRLPAIYYTPEFVEDGGLMSYGVSITDLDRHAAIYVDKILKGAKPTDLPVEQPKKFEFVVNLKAAKQIGLIIPPNVLARADKVIK